MSFRALAVLWIALALVCATPARAAAYDLLLLRQDWAPNWVDDPACANSACGNKLSYGAFTVRDLAPSMDNTQGLAGCSGPDFDAAQIPAEVQAELLCVLSAAESAWEAVWNGEGRCSGLNISQYFTFLAASYNLFNANAPLAQAGISAPTADRGEVVAALKSAWGVMPWVACNPSTKSLLYISLCLDPRAAASGVVQPVDCPWDMAADVPSGAECAGDLTLLQGSQPSENCSAYFPAALDGAYTAPDLGAVSGGGGGAASETGESVADVATGVGETATAVGVGQTGEGETDGSTDGSGTGLDAPLDGPASTGQASNVETGGGAPGDTALAQPEDAPLAVPEAAASPEPSRGDAQGTAPAAGWAQEPQWGDLNPGSATVGTGAAFLQALASGVGNITLSGNIAFAPGDFHFQEYTLPINVSGAVWLRAADPSSPVVLDWSNVSGLINVYEDSTLVLEGIISENVGDGEEAIANRTVRVQVVGSPLWPTVTGADGHQVLFLDSYLVVPDPNLFQQASSVLQNVSAPAPSNGGGGWGVMYENLTVVTPALAMVDLMQLPGLGMGGGLSYTAGKALYSLVNTTADTAPPPEPAPDTGSSGLGAGAIAGIAVGAALGAAAALAACVVWRRRRAAARVADPGKGGGRGGASGGKGDSFGGNTSSFAFAVKPSAAAALAAAGAGAAAGAAAGDVALQVEGSSDDASSLHDATASAGSAGGGGGAKPAFARQVSDGSSPGTAHSVLPGGRNPFHSNTTRPSGQGEGDSDDAFLSFIRTKLQLPGDPPAASPPPSFPPSRQTSLTPSARRSALSSSDSALWDIPFEQLHLQGKIGEGAFGRVYMGEWHATPVAVKLLLPQAQLQDTGSIAEALAKPSPVLTRLQEEADLMFSLRHPNCVQLMGTCLAPPCLVTEYCQRGSLADCLREARRHRDAADCLTWHRRLLMALDAAKGMLYLHSYQPPIVHRDLKSPNLLVDKDWNVKVADFNLSKILGEDHSTSQEVTNPRWLAPEVLQGELATPPSDVFGFGVVLWELLTFQLPWCQSAVPFNPWQLARMVLGGARLPVPPPELLPGPDALPPAVLQQYVWLMERCWEASPADRPTFAAIAAQLRDMVQRLPLQGG